MAVCAIDGPGAVGRPQAGKPIHTPLWVSKEYDSQGHHCVDHQAHFSQCLGPQLCTCQCQNDLPWTGGSAGS